MFFGRKDKNKKQGQKPGKAQSGSATAKKAASGKTSQPAAKGKASGNGASGSPSRSEAEQQVMQMLQDGSLDKYKAMMNADRPQDVVDKYPQETVNLIRSWLHHNKG